MGSCIENSVLGTVPDICQGVVITGLILVENMGFEANHKEMSDSDPVFLLSSQCCMNSLFHCVGQHIRIHHTFW